MGSGSESDVRVHVLSRSIVLPPSSGSGWLSMPAMYSLPVVSPYACNESLHGFTARLWARWSERKRL